MVSPSLRRRLACLSTAVMLVAVLAGRDAGASPTSGGPVLAPTGQGTLVVIGDSLMEGTAVFGTLQKRLTALGTWPRVTVDYRRGRTTPQGMRVLADRLAATPDATAIVVALGTNDMLHNTARDWPARIIHDMMSESLGLPVLWVNISFSRGHPDWRVRAARFNRALLAARADWPNLSVADWSRAFVPAGRSNYIIDGIHLSNSAYRFRAGWLTQETARFGTQIVNATSTTTSTSTSTTTSTTVPFTTLAPTTTVTPTGATSTTVPSTTP